MPILETSLIYLGLFAMVYVLLVAEERTQNTLARVCLLTAAVLMPALLSALRDVSVGTDTQMYLDGIRLLMENGKLPEPFVRFEIGFTILAQILTECFDSPQIVLLCFYVLIFGIAIWAFDRLRALTPIRLTYPFYLILCLILSWNALRQMLSCSFLLLGFSYLLTGNHWRCLLAMSASVLFHISSIVCLAMLPLAVLSRTSVKIYLALIAVVAAVGVALVVAIMPEYARHVRTFTGGTRHAVIKHFITCGALAVAVFQVTKKTPDLCVFTWRKPLTVFLGQLVLLALVLQFFHFSIDWADRLLMTFMPIFSFVCAYAFAHGSVPIKLAALAYVIPYTFFYHYIACNQNECNVYAFVF